MKIFVSRSPDSADLHLVGWIRCFGHHWSSSN